MKKIDIDKIVDSCFSESIRLTHSYERITSSPPDARDILKNALKSYDSLMRNAPEELRPAIAHVVSESFETMMDPALEAYDWTVSKIQEKCTWANIFAQVFEDYNEKIGVPQKTYYHDKWIVKDECLPHYFQRGGTLRERCYHRKGLEPDKSGLWFHAPDRFYEQMLGNIFTVEVKSPVGKQDKTSRKINLLNYGTVKDITEPPGKIIEAYVLGINEPLLSFRGRCRGFFSDREYKKTRTIFAPHDMKLTTKIARSLIEYQEGRSPHCKIHIDENVYRDAYAHTAVALNGK